MTTKTINPSVLFYHCFEVEDSDGNKMYALYDVDMDMPIRYGSKGLIIDIVKNKLPKDAIVMYYVQLTEMKEQYKAGKVTFFKNPPQRRYMSTKNGNFGNTPND